MLRWLLTLLGIGVLAVVTAVLVAPAFFPPAALPVLENTPTPSALLVETTPVEEDRPTPPHLPALVDVRQSLHLSLPAMWRTAYISANDAEGRLQQLSLGDHKLSRQAARTLMSGMDAGAVFIAGSHDVGDRSADSARLFIFAMQRNGLSLEHYLQDVARQLTAQGATIAGTSITADYRADRLPVGLLRYRLPVTVGQAAAEPVSGIQLVTFDRSAERLLVFTIMTTAGAESDLEQRAFEVLRGTAF